MKRLIRSALRLLMTAAACFLLTLGVRAWDQGWNGSCDPESASELSFVM